MYSCCVNIRCSINLIEKCNKVEKETPELLLNREECSIVWKFTSYVMISFPPFEEREGVPAQLHGSESEGVGRGSVLVPEIGTETGGEAAHALLTEGVQGEKHILEH